MVTNETEERNEVMEKRIGLIQQGVKYGLGIAFAGALLCVGLMLPVVVLFISPPGESPDGAGLTSLVFIVSLVVPLAGIAVLGVGLYRLIPLYIQYRHTNRLDEDMFP